jgi:hypothetical protein
MSCLGYEYDPPMRQVVEDAVVVKQAVGELHAVFERKSSVQTAE